MSSSTPSRLPWIDRQSCEAVGKSITERLGGSYECTSYRSPADVM
jgi:hypothetical protein